MLVSTGFFDNQGSPSLNLALGGVVGGKKDFTAIIDTGFSGFVSMPVMQAFPLGLPLFGTTTVILADGQSQAKLMAQAEATLGDRSEVGLVLVTSGTIFLYDEKQFSEELKAPQDATGSDDDLS